MNNNHFLFVAFFQLDHLGKSLQLVNYKRQHQSFLISFLIFYTLPGLFKAPKNVPFFMFKENFQGIQDIRLLYWLCFTATSGDALKVSPAVLSMCKNISRIQVYNYLCFPTPPIKLKSRRQTCRRLLIAILLDWSIREQLIIIFIILFSGRCLLCLLPASAN